jgi:hypothetical protein
MPNAMQARRASFRGASVRCHQLLGTPASSDDDPSWIAEMAYDQGVDFYLATDAIRQGVFNLMVAGLFHLFEQQAVAMQMCSRDR